MDNQLVMNQKMLRKSAISPFQKMEILQSGKKHFGSNLFYNNEDEDKELISLSF